MYVNVVKYEVSSSTLLMKNQQRINTLKPKFWYNKTLNNNSLPCDEEKQIVFDRGILNRTTSNGGDLW